MADVNSIRPKAIKTAHVKTRPRVRYSGTIRLTDFRVDCVKPCGLIVQGQDERQVKRTMSQHYDDCKHAKAAGLVPAADAATAAA